MHSNRSDGREPTGACCCRLPPHWVGFHGADRPPPICPITEKRSKLLPVWQIDLRIYPGEEVHHQPYNPVHIVNFGGQWSVNNLIDAQSPYLAEVEALAATITDPSVCGGSSVASMRSRYGLMKKFVKPVVSPFSATPIGWKDCVITYRKR